MNSFPYLLLKKQMPLMPSEGKKVWTNPYSEDLKITSRIFEQNISFREPHPPQEKMNFQGLTSSRAQNLKTEVDPEIIHELPYKDYLITRTQPHKLEKLTKIIEMQKNPRSIRERRPMKRLEGKSEEKTGNISVQGYLEYLNSQSDKGLRSFRQKMTKSKDLEATSPHKNHSLSARWNDDYNPRAKTEINLVNKTEKNVQSLSLHAIKSHKQDKEEIPSKAGSIILSNPEREKTNCDPLTKSKLNGSLSLRNLGRPEVDQNVSSAQKLAEDIANNYRLCKEKALKQRELFFQLSNYLESAGVWEVFQTRPENKFLPLSNRIYSQLIENVESFEPENFNPSDKKSKNRSIVQFRPKIIQHRYHLFQKVNEKLMDLNIQYKVQGLQSLETNLLQAHEDLQNQKNKTLKQISKTGHNRIQGVVSNYYQNVNILPQLQGDLGDPRHFGTDTPVFDEMSKEKKEIRLINIKLSQVLKNWQKSLSNIQ